MSFFRAADRIILFTHVPKCAGSSVEDALRVNGFALSFYDGWFWRVSGPLWYRSSPQHLERAQLDRLFAQGFFDYEFAVVRDPMIRFLSAFNHNRRRIGLWVSFDRFLSRLEARVVARGDYFSWQFDNHFLPAARFIGEEAKVFHLEDGLARVFETLSADLGLTLTPPATHRNTGTYDVAQSHSPLKQTLKRNLLPASLTLEMLTPEQIDRLRRLYAEDYARFGP